MTPTRPLLLAAVTGLVATGCATATPVPTPRIRPPRQQGVPTITVVPAGSPTPVSHSPRLSPRMAVARFAAAYPRYLNGRLPARRLPGLSAAALAGVKQARSRAVRLRVISLDQGAGTWTIRYAATTGRRHGTVIARVSLTRTRHGWAIAQIDPPDLDQIAATHPTPSSPPRALRAATLAFTRGYLAYTYGQAPAAALTHLTPALRRQLTAHPPTVPAVVRTRHPRVMRLALARPTRAVWLASAQVSDGANSYAVDSTLTHTRSGWIVRRVSTGS